MIIRKSTQNPYQKKEVSDLPKIVFLIGFYQSKSVFNNLLYQCDVIKFFRDNKQ